MLTPKRRVIDEKIVLVCLEGLLYVPKAGCNLYSPGLALEYGFKMSWDQDTMMFGMMFDGIEVLRAVHKHRLWAFIAHNIGGVNVDKKTTLVKRHIVANFAVTDGVEDTDVWHAHLGHPCPEYILLMVDRSMAKGIMLKKRGKMDCADCHFGKQRCKTYKKSLERNIAQVNGMIFADLLIPGLHNGTRYSAVLVVTDGVSRFVTTYLLRSKSKDEVNGVDTAVTGRWNAEKEFSDEQDGVIRPVKQVLMDKSAEICNNSIARWYAKKGIFHTKVGPKSSQLNLVERTHQTLIGMSAVYIKNKVLCKSTGRTPYGIMYGSKPKIHHIRTLGSLVYCHTPLTKRKKLEVNCKVGFLIDYKEDDVDCQEYFPTEHQKGFVANVKVNETIKYKNRYDLDDVEYDSEESQRAECDVNSVCDDSNIEMQSAVVSADDLNEAEQELWDMVHNIQQRSSSGLADSD
ncbi:Rve-domain-containing hypothetical protein [Phytophthora megakarya]|uniref:Integrase catalytic domain-containing protein n=1 Tax=Phytophthora megakarya TaxID=4795 RepID=A0A225WMD8_9STRA|nr:Rve-domain-containing hypothetical protein [Phytophthora megakarya]